MPSFDYGKMMMTMTDAHDGEDDDGMDEVREGQSLSLLGRKRRERERRWKKKGYLLHYCLRDDFDHQSVYFHHQHRHHFYYGEKRERKKSCLRRHLS